MPSKTKARSRSSRRAIKGKAAAASKTAAAKPNVAAQPNATAPAAAPAKPAVTKPAATVTAVEMGARQRDISVSEVFTKNRHLLGFDNPRKALLTCVKEAVDNALDACEEAGILPDSVVKVELLAQGEPAPPASQASRFRITVTDNGPGIVRQQIPPIFAKLLYGSKFHRLRQSRGQQGIGISAAGMYGQLTTGNAVRVRSKPGKRGTPMAFEIRIDTAKNRPDATEKVIEWEKDHGTEVSIDLEGEYRRGQKSVEEFLKLMAVANPHVQLKFTDPDNNVLDFQRGTKELPKEVEEIKPHPHGVELGILLKMIQESDNRT